MKTIVIIGIGNVALKYLDQALHRQGYTPIVLGRRAALCKAMAPYVSGLQWYDVDPEDERAVYDEIRLHPARYEAVSAITTLYDERFPQVVRLGQCFGWQTPPPCLAQLSAKRQVQAWVPEYSPPTLSFQAGEIDTLDLSALAQWGKQVVAKPALASGGLGAAHLPTRHLHTHLRTHLAALQGAAGNEWLLQQALMGRLLSFEGYVADGEVHGLGISSRSRLGLTEVANRYPVGEHVPEAVHDLGWGCIRALAQRSGLRFGYFHCEFIQANGRPWLIDANAGRIGGATMLEQIACAHGVNTADLLAHVLLLPLLGSAAPCPLDAAPARAPAPTLGIWYGSPVVARLEQLDVPAPQCCHTQFAVEGHTVPAIGTSDHAWVGQLSGDADTVLQTIKGITLLTDQGRLKPAYNLS
ncbi:hypothetical protein [Pseudomonas typographi]|uniref:hypothetical protein n=1 Tax=Pseudomonas typographi TaxID=2715964 RepID=UPI00168740D4|nr:hypothetical protein [Pseudomonas typographi]MBD1587293.1 hypothetical protein [Pseudomonas typographi]